MKIRFQQAKEIVLPATYETLIYHAEFASFTATDIHKRVEENFSAGFVQRLLTSLVYDELVMIERYDETSLSHYTLSDKGFEAVENLPSLREAIRLVEHGELIPASDRLVTLNHNQPSYQEISEAFDEAIERAKQIRPNDVSGDEHASVVAGLAAARRLWDAFELTRMQFEVGLLLAVERAENVLKTSFNLVKGPLLMEALKAIYRGASDGNLNS